MKPVLALLKRWREEYSKLTVFGAALVVVCFVPDWQARVDFWVKAFHWGLPHLASPLGRVALLCGGLLIIWLDHRMVLRHRAKPPDDKTLKGRTLAFCEELRAFQKELGQEPQLNWKAGNSATNFTEANKELIEREQRMHHYFHIRFYEKAVGLWHEHGAEMRESEPLASALAGRIGSDEKLNEVIKMFTGLAQD